MVCIVAVVYGIVLDIIGSKTANEYLAVSAEN